MVVCVFIFFLLDNVIMLLRMFDESKEMLFCDGKYFCVRRCGDGIGCNIKD